MSTCAPFVIGCDRWYYSGSKFLSILYANGQHK